MVAALAACASAPATRQFESVPPGKVYYSSYLNIAAPQAEGWHLIESSSVSMSFARSGSQPNESFAAAVAMFDLTEQTNSSAEFEALIIKKASYDLETERFSTTKFEHHYMDIRGYACVQIHNVSEDNQAQVGGGRTERLTLENEHLYCRHPVRTDTGFAITYSHRGNSLYPNLRAEAQSFVQGVQVPNESPPQ